MLTYIGRGYSPAFAVNMTRLLRLMVSGGLVMISPGPDAICAGNAGRAAGRHCRAASVRARDMRATRDLQRLRLVPMDAGVRLQLTPALLARMRGAFATGASRSDCVRCQWKVLCDSVAGSNFAACVLPRAGTARLAPKGVVFVRNSP